MCSLSLFLCFTLLLADIYPTCRFICRSRSCSLSTKCVGLYTWPKRTGFARIRGYFHSGMIIRVPEGVTGVKVMTDTDIKDVCSYFQLSSTLPVYISGSKAKTLCSVDGDNEMMMQAEKPNDSSPAKVSAEMTMRMADDHGIKLQTPNTPVIMDSESDDIESKVTRTPGMSPHPDNGRGIFSSTLPRAGDTYHELEDETILGISVPSSVVVFFCMCAYLYCKWRRRDMHSANESGLELIPPPPQTPPDLRHAIQTQPQTPSDLGQNTPDFGTPAQTMGQNYTAYTTTNSTQTKREAEKHETEFPISFIV